MAQLGIVEEGDAETIGLGQVAKVDIGLGAADQLAGDLDGPLTVLPFGAGLDVAAVSLNEVSSPELPERNPSNSGMSGYNPQFRTFLKHNDYAKFLC